MALDTEEKYDHLIENEEETGADELPMKKKSSNLIIIAFMLPVLAFGGWTLGKQFGIFGQEEAPVVTQQLPIKSIIKTAPVVKPEAIQPADKAPGDLTAEPALTSPEGAAAIVPGTDKDLSKDPSSPAPAPELSASKADPLADKDKAALKAADKAADIVATPAIVGASKKAEAKLAEPVNAPVAAIEDTANPTAHMSDITVVNTRLDKLEGLINQLTDAIKNLPGPSSFSGEQTHPAKVHKVHTKKWKAVAHKKVKEDQFTAIKVNATDAKAADLKVTEVKSTEVKSNDVKSKLASNDTTYHTRVVIPGRAWLISKDGTYSTVIVGDSLPSAGKVKSINVDTGEVVIENGQTIKMGNGD